MNLDVSGGDWVQERFICDGKSLSFKQSHFPIFPYKTTQLLKTDILKISTRGISWLKFLSCCLSMELIVANRASIGKRNECAQNVFNC